MADKRIEIVIKARDEASKAFQRMGGTIQKVNKSIEASLKRATLASAAFAGALVLGIRDVVKASNEMENAMLGLTSVARAMGAGADEATQAAKRLAEDGLLTVKDAAEGLKNLLATGFSLPEAVNLMNAFRDSAAFNRQGMLGFGQAIVGATQGIKNQNSVMVDNAGITKNLSIILKEAGLSAGDLSLVTSDLTVRTALYNGILKEALIFQGDAARSAETFSGRMTTLNARIFDVKVEIGDKLKPVLAGLLEQLLKLIGKVGSLIDFLENNKDMVIIVAGAIAGALTPSLIAATAAAIGLAVALAPFIIAGGILATLFNLLNRFVKEQTGFTFFEQLTALVQITSSAVREVIDQFRALGQVLNDIFGDGGKLDRFNVKDQFQALAEIVGGRQFGGFVTPGQPVIVGERGPEMFVPSSPGRVDPSVSPMAAPVTLNAHVHIGLFAGTAVERRQVAETLMKEFSFLARSKGRTVWEEIQEGSEF